MQDSIRLIEPDNKAEIAPVLISIYSAKDFPREQSLYEGSLDIQQCSNETKGRILKSIIDNTDWE